MSAATEMKRNLTIIAGPGEGAVLPLTGDRILVGRSKDADVKLTDLKASKRQLELRVEADGVYGRNLSDKGTLLNDEAIVGEVSLNAGDILTMGDTKLRFDEAPAEPAAPPRAQPVPAVVDPEATRLAGPELVGGEAAGAGGSEETAGGKTKAFGEGHTKALDDKELAALGIRWRAQEQPGDQRRGTSVWGALLVVLLLGGLWGGYWYGFGRVREGSLETVPYQDPSGEFSCHYPADWRREADQPGVVTFAYGADGAVESARVKIYVDKEVKHSLTGLTHGFLEYREVLEHRADGLAVGDNYSIKHINGALLMAFSMRSPARRGLGLFALNADTRIIVECSCPLASYAQFADNFYALCGSFNLKEGAGQQCFDFPEPTVALRDLALTNEVVLGRLIQTHCDRGEALVAGRDVKPDNLYRAVQELQLGCQLAVAPPRPRVAPGYNAAAQSLAQANRLFNEAVTQQRFAIARARKEGDITAAYWAAEYLLRMVPAKTDPIYQEAHRTMETLPVPKNSR